MHRLAEAPGQSVGIDVPVSRSLGALGAAPRLRSAERAWEGFRRRDGGWRVQNPAPPHSI